MLISIQCYTFFILSFDKNFKYKNITEWNKTYLSQIIMGLLMSCDSTIMSLAMSN